MATARDWHGHMGRNWAGRCDAMERQLAPLGDVGLAALAPAPGERVIDLGCGAGATAREIAARVGPEGRVTGIDISPELAALARERAQGLRQLSVIEADAQTHPFEPGAHDALFSRVGCMFFDDPPRAFANLHRTLAPGGRAVFVVFTNPGDNPWGALPMAALDSVLGPPPPERAASPGPFSWSDPGLFVPLLEGAGFTGLDWRAHELVLRVGDGPSEDPVERAVHLMLRIGPVAARLREAPAGAGEAVATRLRELLAPYAGAGPLLELPARAWCIEAAA